MADLAEQLLEKTATEYAVVLGLNGSQNDAANKLRQQSAPSVLKGVKEFHDSIHSFDGEGQSQFISELIIDNMHEEQVWQQQEVQMTAVNRFLHEKNTVTNLEQLHIQFASCSNNTGHKLNGQSKKLETSDLKDVDDDNDDDDEEMEDIDSEDSDPELSEIKKRLKNDDGFGDFDGSDNDLLDGAQKEWDEDKEEEDDEDENDFDFDIPSNKKVEQKQKEQKAHQSKKRKTEVDDKSFKLAEMEFFDQEDAKEERKNKRGEDKDGGGSDESEDEKDGGGQNMDMFSAWPDEETDKECMYGDFFDAPEGADNSQQAMATESASEGGEVEENESEEEDTDSDEEGPQSSKKKVRFSANTKGAKEGGSDKQSLSNFEKKTEKLRRQIQSLEDQSLAVRPWQLMGEVAAGDRPENSMLQEHVDFRQAPPSAAEMTEERAKSIEDITLQRVKDKSFDDNQRQVRPVEEAFELKTQKIVDQEKSKLSLHEEYEQEFLKMQAPEDEEKTNPVHDEIKKTMDNLFPRLDALASWHYTPLQAVPELRVKNNLPSMRMEEPTPITMSNAAVLAPEEVQAKKKGELKGKAERTKEDKHRERKQKKAAKREKSKEKDKQRKEVEKMNPGMGNKYSKERALKELEKEAKGTIEVIKDKNKKKSMSSKAFFTQLQEEVTTQTASKTKKKIKQKSSDKLLL